MKRILDVITIVAALVMLSRHIGVEFVNEHSKWFASVFLFTLIINIGYSINEKRVKKL